MHRFRSLVCVLVTIIAGLNASAQQITGSIRGTISDPSGAVVRAPRSPRRMSKPASTRTATTDRDGNYCAGRTPSRPLPARSQAKGFQKYLQEGISLNVNETRIGAGPSRGRR